MAMALDEARDDESPGKIHHARSGADLLSDLFVRADGDDAVAADRDCLRVRMRRVNGGDVAANEHEIGGRSTSGWGARTLAAKRDEKQ